MQNQRSINLPLVIVATEKEGLGFVNGFGLERDSNLRIPLPGLKKEKNAGLYYGSQLNLAITGVLEHNMVAATSLILRHLKESVSFVLNFGAVGYYPQQHEGVSLTVGETVLVRQVYRFDVDDNLHWVPPVTLSTPAIDLQSVICVTGSRYSTEKDRESPYFPKSGQVEDMELYGLAVLLQSLKIPLISVKFVSNIVNADGREQMRQNLSSLRKRAEQTVIKVLEQYKKEV